MVSFVFLTVIFNFSIGLLLSLLLSPRAQRAKPASNRPAPPPRPIELVTSSTEISEPRKEAPAPQPVPVRFVMEDLSPAWVEKLASESVQAKSLVEASTLVLRLEVGKYRESLVECEYAVRKIPDAEFASKIRDPIAEVVRLNEEWLKIQSDAVALLTGKSKDLGEFAELSSQLEEILLGQTSQIESTANNLLQLRTSDDPAELRVVIVREIQRLIDLSHRLRDAIQSILLTILIADKRIDRVEKRMTVDAHTQLLTAIGIEGVFETWRLSDPSRQKQSCVGLLALDFFKNHNEKLGTRHADALLLEAAKLCAETIRKDRGFDRIARVSGDVFAMFYGDTAIRSGVAAIERLRQSLLQSTFHVDGEPISLNATCVVVAQLRSDTLSHTLRRASEAMKLGKAKGRDQIVIDEGNGPEIIEPPPMTVRPSVIEVPYVG